MPPTSELTRIEPFRLELFRAAAVRAAGQLRVEAWSDPMIETWWEQARPLEDE